MTLTLVEQLLQSQNSPITLEVFGGQYPAHRLPQQRLADLQKEITCHGETGDIENTGVASAKLILESLIDEHGAPMIETIEPAELVSVHSPIAISSAVTAIMDANFTTEAGLSDAKND
ncbi:MAG: hypothetical protein OIF38_16925 [Cellvibrionaceae bacterium]|nr:hypothetical protein [Cellvibrionaceae bacterium]